ncbi:hypothetical protein GIB67_002925 [Kingdonia uniflora]|uniref:CoA carboxyltransferase N-terminal domain-containing protein n=1 Tax=Kingdonia uniflora TaxID=39325 RepID=A0A7J7MIQ8_9MAGN|nr:hypothetical protein GIB67_002925 [Kingdonia uniflora]
MNSSDRIELLVDPDTWYPMDEDMVSIDPVEFHSEDKPYKDCIDYYKRVTELTETVQTDIVCASGGGRMQEGSLSLMQMAKISFDLYNYQSNKKLFYVSLLTSPTTGRVTASSGMLGDIIIAEPYATIAFTGKRVIEETLKVTVLEKQQETEYLFEKGLFDLILLRNLLKDVLKKLEAFTKKFLELAHKVDNLDQKTTVTAFTNTLQLDCKAKEHLFLNKPATLKDMIMEVNSYANLERMMPERHKSTKSILTTHGLPTDRNTEEKED